MKPERAVRWAAWQVVLGIGGLLALVLGLVACQAQVTPDAPAITQASPDSVPTATPGATDGAAPVPSQSTADLIANAQAEALSHHPFRAYVEVALANGSIMTTTLEYAPIGRIRASLPTGADVLVLSDQGTVYQRDNAEGPWLPMPGQLAMSLFDAADFLNPKRIEALRGQLSTQGASFLGEVSLDESPTWLYEYQKIETILGQETAGTERIWIGQSDRLVHRLETETNAVPGAGHLQIAVTYTYDPAIKIDAPTP